MILPTPTRSGLPLRPGAFETLGEALDYAAGAGNTAMLDFLLAAGADLDADGVRALASAARHLAYDAFDWLHEHGVDAGDEDG